MNKRRLLNIVILALVGYSQFFLYGEQSKKITLEFSSSYMFANPKHLNYLPDTELQFLSFYLDPVYETKKSEGSLDPIKVFFAIQPRIKYAVTPSINISVGFSYLWRNQTNSYNVLYTRSEGWRVLNDELDYPEMNTKIRGVIPSIGFHYRFPMSKKTKVECSVIGGPLFTTIKYNKMVSQSITSVYEPAFPFWSSKTNITMDGKGTGISLTGSLKIEKKLYRSVGIFLEGGYSFQRVNNIEGNGSETINGNLTSFSGEWGLVEEHVTTNRGETKFVFPTNHWKALGQKSQDFILNLSGIFLSAGITFSF